MKRALGLTVSLSLTIVLLSLFCTDVIKPGVELNSCSITISTEKTRWTVGEAVKVRGSIEAVNFVDSVMVQYGDASNTKSFVPSADTFSVSSSFTSEGPKKIIAIAYLRGDTTRSDTVDVSIGIAPSASSGVQTVGVPSAGSAFFLWVTAAGSDTLSYQWYKQNQIISGAIKDTLTFLPVTLADSGLYSCLIKNAWGELHTLPFQLTFGGTQSHAPQFKTYQPTAVVKVGQLLALPLKAEDADGDELTFSIVNPDSFTANEITLQTNGDSATIKFTPQKVGTRVIKVQVSDGPHTASATITVQVDPANVNSRPKFAAYDSSESVTVKKTLTLALDASDADSDPISFTLLNDSYATGEIDTATTDKRFTVQYTPATVGVKTIRVMVSDGKLSDTARVKVSAVAGDQIKPVISLVDQNLDGTTINTNSKRVEAIITDNTGVDSVSFMVGARSFAVTRVGDSLYYANITSLVQNVFTTIWIHAQDSAGNKDSLSLQIKYDPTAEDKQPPEFVWKGGPQPGQRVLVDTATILYKISDPSGLDTVYYTLNGVFQAALTAAGADSVFNLHYTLSKYGVNRLVLYAVDNSTAHNLDSEVVELNYNTRLSAFNLLSPADGATDVEYSNGVLLHWNKATDADGDSITYKVFYSESTTVFQSFSTKEDTLRLKGLSSNAKYNIYIRAMTVLDTTRYPAEEGTYHTFTTRFQPAIITGLIDKNATIDDTLAFDVSASGPEAIKEYRWDFNGDNTVDQTTQTGAVTFKAPSTAGSFNCVLAVVDQRGGITRDTAILTITNGKPVITSPDPAVDTIKFDYSDTIKLHAAATDDGKKLSYEWDVGDGTFRKSVSGDTAFVCTQTLPAVIKCRLRVTDEDGNSTVDSVYASVDLRMSNLVSNYTFGVGSLCGLFQFKDKWYLDANSIPNPKKQTDMVQYRYMASNDLQNWVELPNTYWGTTAAYPGYDNDKLYAWSGPFVCYSTDGTVFKKVMSPNVGSCSYEFMRAGTHAYMVSDSGVYRIEPSGDSIKVKKTPASRKENGYLPNYFDGTSTWFLGGANRAYLYRLVDDTTAPVSYIRMLSCGSNTISDLYLDNGILWIFRAGDIIASKDYGQTYKTISNSTPWGSSITGISVAKKDDGIYVYTSVGVWKYPKSLPFFQ